jgi:tripartite-type tricarboxylate transporter receptor subunit TctC
LKEKAGKAAYGSPTSISLACAEVYLGAVGATARLVRYKASQNALNELKAGEIDFFFIDSTAAIGPAKRGDIRLLAVSTTTRTTALPDVPTMQEAGVPDFEVDSWYAMFVPAKTPKPVVEKLNKALNQVVADPDIKEKLLAQGSEGVGGTPEMLGKVVASELPKWARLVRQANIKAD